MIDFITTTEMTEHPVVVSCLLGSRHNGSGVSGAVPSGGNRPTKALEAAAVAQAAAYAAVFAADGAGEGRQKTQHNLKWAFRGLEPWRDPA